MSLWRSHFDNRKRWLNCLIVELLHGSVWCLPPATSLRWNSAISARSAGKDMTTEGIEATELHRKGFLFFAFNRLAFGLSGAPLLHQRFSLRPPVQALVRGQTLLK